MGDFNIDLSSTCCISEDFLAGVQCLGLEQIITSPTRKTHNSQTLIDHIYTNLRVDKNYAGVILTDLSDHFPICALFTNTRYNDMRGHKIKFRDYRKYQKDEYNNDLANLPWNEIYSCTDVNVGYAKFLKLLENACDMHAPFVERSTRQGKSKPWITRSLKKSIKQKHKLYSRVLSSNFDTNVYSKL